MKKYIIILSVILTFILNPVFSFGQQGWLPPGTTITLNVGNLDYSAPSGWQYIGVKADGAIVNAGADGTVSCTCNTSGKCMPFSGSGGGSSTTGCAGDCTNCTMKQSVVAGGISTEVVTGGYYNPNLETIVILNGDNYPSVFDALYELPSFQTKLQTFYDSAYNGQPVPQMITTNGVVTAPEGYSLICIAIMGRGLLVVVPESYATIAVGYDVNAKASCSCTQGDCTLKSKGLLGYGAKWCDGNCSGTCTLSTGVTPSEGQQYAVNIEYYSY